jgi:hypothetical protein
MSGRDYINYISSIIHEQGYHVLRAVTYVTPDSALIKFVQDHQRYVSLSLYPIADYG